MAKDTVPDVVALSRVLALQPGALLYHVFVYEEYLVLQNIQSFLS